MLELRSELLFEMAADLRETPWAVGEGPLGVRMIHDVVGGRLWGARVNGKVLPSGADWILLGPDGCGRLDVRVAVELDDGGVLYATYGGRLMVPPALATKVFDRATAEEVDPSQYYFRTAPTFETGSKTYAWLNRVQAVGVGRITRTGVAYKVYEIL
jgi:hypothetical protein